MSEEPVLPPPDQQPAVDVVTRPQGRHELLAWLCAIGFIVLAAAIGLSWWYPRGSAFQTVDRQFAVIDSRLGRLEQRPDANIGQLENRVDMLDGRIGEQSKLAGRLDTLSGRIESLSGRSQSGYDTLKQQLDDLSRRVAAIEADGADLKAAANRLNRVARLQEASFALDAGRPIGDIPDAPEELARFANTPPPTDMKLRLMFPPAAQAALASKQPDAGTAPLLDRVLEHAESLITIRRGDRVLVGDSTAVTLNRARSALDSGDLPTAVAAVQSLSGEPAQAMSKWLAQAKALLGARAVLADMIDHT